MDSGRDNMIPFWRVVFTYVVMVLHLFNQYGHWTGWAIGVEFFFIVSGWLMAADIANKNRTPYEYTWHRIKRLYPEYLPAFLVSSGCLIVFRNYSMQDAIRWGGTIGVRELLCIHYWPWGDAPIANGVTWYISVLLLAGLFLYSLCKAFPAITKEILIPLSIIIGLTYSYRRNGNLTVDFYEGIFYHHWFVRGFLELGIGILLYDFKEKYEKYLKNKAVQLLGFVLLLFTIGASYSWHGKAEYLYLLFISLGVAISFNTKQPIKTKVLVFFDKISYSLLLNHIIFRSYIIPKFFDSLSIRAVLVYLAAVTGFSIFMFYFSKMSSGLCGNLCRYIFKKQLSKEE